MPERIDLYDSHYSHDEADVYRAIRRETFGEDLRQASWITAPECDELCSWLGLFPSSAVLEVACGSGGVALRIAERFRCSVVGVDINEAAISAATRRSAERGGTGRTRFRVGDGDEPLPFDDDSFDAVFCNDAINHLKDRERVLADWHRLL
ncbi:MAG: class I SAM-dependent methyltransferase, partial [Acidobacteriota bacterium]|nr:class I SAM-dependent methyltransferase [Acidobacteriota bacterium]